MKLPHNIPDNTYLIDNVNSIKLAGILLLVYFINDTNSGFEETHA